MKGKRGLRDFAVLLGAVGLVALTGCREVLNAPRPVSEYATNTIFSTFSLSPKTLDPQVSYSQGESVFVYLTYEPPYAYHYLKRPFTLEARSVECVAVPEHLDQDGKVLSHNAPASSIAVSRYTLKVKSGIFFAPHPAFAKDETGSYRYHNLPEKTAASLSSPLDLPYKDTRELVADDFVYAIKRMASPRLVSPVLRVLGEHMPGLIDLSRRLEKKEATNRPTWLDLRSEALEGVRTLDRMTFQIDVKGKYPQFSNWLAMSFFAPVPWEAEAFYANEKLKEGNITLASWPVGTGPYYMAVSRQNREHVLKKNPLFHTVLYPCEGDQNDEKEGFLKDCGKKLPLTDRIVLTIEKESVPTTSKFLQGFYDSPEITRLDVGQGFMTAALDNPEKGKLYEERRLQFPKTVGSNITYLGFNWLDPVVGGGKTASQARRNRLLRQAVSIALNWEEKISIFNVGQGMAAAGPLPPGFFGWRPDSPAAFNPVVYKKGSDGRVMRRSLSEAKRLLKAAGYPDGRDAKTGQPLVLNFDWQGAAAGSRAYLEWVTRQFAKLGIQLEIRATDYNRFQDKMQKGAAQIYVWGWLADYPDAENFLFLLYGKNGKVAYGGENASNYVNPGYDRLFETMRYLEDGPEKARLIDRMISIVQEDAPWSFGTFSTAVAASHHWVKNLKPTQIIQDRLMYIGIDAAEREAAVRAWNRPILWPLGVIAGLIVLFLFGVRHVLRARARRKVSSRSAP